MQSTSLLSPILVNLIQSSDQNKQRIKNTKSKTRTYTNTAHHKKSIGCSVLLEENYYQFSLTQTSAY